MMFGMEFWNSGGGLITIVFISTLWLTAIATYSYRKKMQRKGLEPEPKEQRPSKWNWRFWNRNRGPPRDVPMQGQKQGSVLPSNLRQPEGKAGTALTVIPEELEDVEVVIAGMEKKVSALPKIVKKRLMRKLKPKIPITTGDELVQS